MGSKGEPAAEGSEQVVAVEDESLYETMITVENKSIFVDLKRNKSGVYLKISERSGTRRRSILVPATGVLRLANVLEEASKECPVGEDVLVERSVDAVSVPKAPRVRKVVSQNASTEDRAPDSNKVIVSNLSWDTTEQDLSEHFSSVGEVFNSMILMTKQGRSKGSGIVEFANVSIVPAAIARFSNHEFKGRVISVRPYFLQAPSQRAAAGGGDGEVVESAVATRAPRQPKPRVADEDRIPEPTKVFVTSLTWDTTKEDLREYFGGIGEVVHTEVLATRKGRSMGSGIVEFTDAKFVERAIAQLSNQDFKGRVIAVRQYFQ